MRECSCWGCCEKMIRNGFAVSLHKPVHDLKQTGYVTQDLKHEPAGKKWRRG
jgi:hypothetical protein